MGFGRKHGQELGIHISWDGGPPQEDVGDQGGLEGGGSPYLSGADEHQSEGFCTPDESSAGSDPPSPRGAGFESSEPQFPVSSSLSLPPSASEPTQETGPPLVSGTSGPSLVPKPSPPALSRGISVKKSVRLSPVGEHTEIPLPPVVEAQTPREPPDDLPRGARPLTVPHVSSAPASLGRGSSGSVSSGILPYGRQTSGLMKSPFESMDDVEPFSMPPPVRPSVGIRSKAQSMPPTQNFGFVHSNSLKPAISGMEPYKRLHTAQSEDDEAAQSKDGWLSTCALVSWAPRRWPAQVNVRQRLSFSG